MQQLIITKQESLATEKFSRNVVQKDVHLVSKNLPFTIDIECGLNLHQVVLYSKLCYDSDFDEDFKPVDYVKQEPMSYKTFINPEGNKATLEFRLFVLSSQHEDSLFRLRIGILDTPYEVISGPIRVVSKPSQVYKGKKRAPSGPKTPVSPRTPSQQQSTPTNIVGTKRPADDMFLDSLQKLEEEQKRQRQLLEKLIEEKPADQQPPTEKKKPTFEEAFKTFLAAYKTITPEEKPLKLRKLLTQISQEQSHTLVDFVNLCSSPEFQLPVSTLNLESILPKELDAWDSFYHELTSTPSSDL